jgi:hypothetical protein
MRRISIGMRRAIMLLSFVLLSGCLPFPIGKTTYRPEVDLSVVDVQGKAVPHARIETCATTHWAPGCVYRESFRADDHGRVRISAKRRWTWCCLGEAPLPYATFAACDDRGDIAYEMIDEPPRALKLELVVKPGPPPPAPPQGMEQGSVVTPNHGKRGEARRWAMSACEP